MDYESEDKGILTRLGKEALERIGLEPNSVTGCLDATGRYTMDDCAIARSYINALPVTGVYAQRGYGNMLVALARAELKLKLRAEGRI